MNSKFCAKLQKSLEESVANGDEVRIAFSNPLFRAGGENAEKTVLRTGNCVFRRKRVVFKTRKCGRNG